MKIYDQFDPELRNLIRKQSQVAVIPIGSIEQHGPHLPVSTDSEIITEVARKVCKNCGYLLLPTISYGVSFEHSPFFNISITKSTLKLLVADICKSLFENDIKTIFILNGHHGNQKALNDLHQKIKSKKGKVFVFSYWHFMKREFDHAGFVETSLMLAISKKVQMKKAKKGLIISKKSPKEKTRLVKLASKSFPKATINGIWGDPRKASSKQGKLLLSEIERNLSKRCQRCLTDKNRKLHQ